MSNIEILDHAFANCINLEYLDPSLWNTQSLYDIRGVFANCSSLTSINCRNWNTRKVVDMSKAFNGCSNLQFIDLENWDFSNVTDMENMFRDCRSLKKVNVKWNVNYSNANAKGLFYGCANLEELDLKGFDRFWLDGPKPNNKDVFHKCSKLRTLIGGRQSLSEAIFTQAGTSICLGHSPLLDRYSIRAIFNGIPNRRFPYDDLKGRMGVYLHYETRKQVTDEDIAIATSKGWDVNFVEPLWYDKKESYSGNLNKLNS